MGDGESAAIQLTSGDGRLRVEFQWHQDRFLQRVWVDDQPAGHSLEGDSSQLWPPSPPLQQLSLEPICGRPAVLGVGGAGRGHWSISAQASDQNPAAIDFDLACRSRVKAEFLGSSYRLAAGADLLSDSASIGPCAATSQCDREQPPFALPAGCRTLQVTPAESGHVPTVRWSYQLVVAPA